MKSTAKAESMVRVLAETLKMRIANSDAGKVNAIAHAKDSEGYPYITISRNGAVATGDAVILVKISQQDAVSKDILGASLKAAAPHQAVVCVEEASDLLPTDLALVIAELAKAAVQVVVKQTATGTAVTDASATAAAVLEVIEANPLWPTKGN